MTRSKSFASSLEQLSWTCARIDRTFVMGASRGSEESFAKLVRRKPSEAIERMSKLPRLIECSEPRGIDSLACGIDGRAISWLPLCILLNVKTRWVVDLPKHATGDAWTWRRSGSWIFRLNERAPSKSFSLFVWLRRRETSELMRSWSGRPTISCWKWNFNFQKLQI